MINHANYNMQNNIPNNMMNNQNNQFNNFGYSQNQQVAIPQNIMPQINRQQYYNQVSQPYCRVINAQQDIRVDEVPMDGNVGLFITRDMNEIYAKSWNSMTGNIDTIMYKPILEESENVEENKTNVIEDLQKNIDTFKNEIFERFDKLEKSFKQPNNSNSRNNKKESE